MNFIIVLGSSKPEIRKARVEKAVSYYKHLVKDVKPQFDGFATRDKVKLIFAGKGKDPNTTEAQDMRRIAIEMGVSESVCIVEKDSQNTRENMVNTLTILQSFGWFNPTFNLAKPIFTICTSHFHAPRSLVIGMEVLSQYGYINIIHTGEFVPKEIAEYEKELLDQYIKNYTLPKMTMHY
jgi:uncharacterized SAM-binding protein YcdF (DUF218 family)